MLLILRSPDKQINLIVDGKVIYLLILGIDPGTYRLGFGLLQFTTDKPKLMDFGVIKLAKSKPFPDRLNDIHSNIQRLIKKWQPKIMAVEDSFVSHNAKTALRLGHARGVILLAGVQQKLSISEYAPREIKQAVVGNGGASKSQVKWMVQKICQQTDPKMLEDASDAIAVALCHGYRHRQEQILGKRQS